MTKRMLVDASHPEETRVAIVESYRDVNRLEDFDFSLTSKPILRGNIYLAKVMRIEPSLQAAFVEYGGNRHGFLPFSEIHPDYYRIPVADRPHDEEDFDTGETGEDLEDYEDQADTSDDENEDEQEQVAEADATEASEGLAAEHQSIEPQPAPFVEAEANVPPAPAPLPAPSPFGSFAEPIHHDDDVSVGLITDFGNAAVGSHMTEVAMPEAPPESVGGEVTERIERRRRPNYKIQEVLKRGQVMLIQVVKEERGNKGAALTSYLSLAGRYCVLMPNTDHGGGVSRKITNHQDRRRMKEILDQLEIPEGMALILRTAGMEMEPPEIQRDLDYLLRLWDNIREQTLQSSAPALIYEEANLIRRSVRDLYSQNISEILIAGQDGYQRVSDFMRAIMPDQVEKVKLYDDATPLFVRYQVENQIDALHNPVAQLRSGGYLVINPTEALVSIDVNSGRATRERHIEETAVKTNLEAADEIARQLRLRDLAGLVVIDFIDMEDGRNNAAVERRLKEAMKNDRARLQIGRISPFGLLELSRQRLRPSLVEINFEKCPRCGGSGTVRSPDSAALSALRAIEEEAIRKRPSEITMVLPTDVAVFILNNKRETLSDLEIKYGVRVTITTDDGLPPPGYKLEKSKGRSTVRAAAGPAVNTEQLLAETEREVASSQDDDEDTEEAVNTASNDMDDPRGNRRGRRRFRKSPRGQRNRDGDTATDPADSNDKGLEASSDIPESNGNVTDDADMDDNDNQRRRRRGRRGGRRRGQNGQNGGRDFEPREDRRNGNQKRYADAPAQPQMTAPQKTHVPFSIHDIDTTPRHPSEDRRSESQRDRSYETINPPTDRPKGGWWKRLTGQE